ncbi:PREDICTED: uncharacterized protein LOC107339801 [Acropora digitifera]|uniref:uncharacterized protein LOC107339801 n=1 Tax=Acropora digitifera TaxID=70779 RepID=UPI00077AA06F|nr:PREDICTED: uncharacterized protein LOC107339801 [Acropora digitifera]
MKLPDGRSSSFPGRGTMKINLGDRELAHTIWVTDIEPADIIPLRVLNPRDYPCTLYKDTVAAMCEPVDLVEALHIWENNVALCQKHEKGDSLTDAVDNDGETLSVPKHLADLFQRSSHLLNPDERSQLARVLTGFAGVFAASSDDLGHTSLVTYQINTGSSQPIRQPTRRLPLHKRADADTLLKDMLKKGVIEPSSSPWTSPIVLVRKKDGSTPFCVDYRKLNEVKVTRFQGLTTAWMLLQDATGFPP